ncbi:MAG TPA: helix-turn-helix domain-containing protein [archaeon]|nr:helix-turn-helix domain-containing protein [archaeon]
MKIFCEVMVQDILPATRALLAKELIEKYKMTQQAVALRLGVSQGAVSQYLRSVRGQNVKQITNDKKIMDTIHALAAKVAATDEKTLPVMSIYDEICELCRNEVRSKSAKSSKTTVGLEKCLPV